MRIPLVYHCPSCDAACDCSAKHRDLGRCGTCGGPAVWTYGAKPGAGTLIIFCECEDWTHYELASSRAEPAFARPQPTAAGYASPPARCPRCGEEMRELVPEDWTTPMQLPDDAELLPPHYVRRDGSLYESGWCGCLASALSLAAVAVILWFFGEYLLEFLMGVYELVRTFYRAFTA